MLKREYIKNKKNFNINFAVEKCLYAYNNKKHYSTKFEPFYLFTSVNKEDLNKACENNNKKRKKN